MSGYTAAFTCDREDRTMDDVAPSGWLTSAEVAELAKCSTDTVGRAIRTGAIKRVTQTGGGTFLINRDEGIEWAAKYEPYSGLKRKESDP